MTPSARAVLRLTTSSNVVGCSIGMSAGFAGEVDRGKFRLERALGHPGGGCEGDRITHDEEGVDPATSSPR
jgi:hypothetical protein